MNKDFSLQFAVCRHNSSPSGISNYYLLLFWVNHSSMALITNLFIHLGGFYHNCVVSIKLSMSSFTEGLHLPGRGAQMLEGLSTFCSRTEQSITALTVWWKRNVNNESDKHSILQGWESSSSSAFSAISLGFTIAGKMFAYVTVFLLNLPIEVITFCIHGWCMLGVFLLPVFTHRRHEYQNLVSPCDGLHVCTY